MQSEAVSTNVDAASYIEDQADIISKGGYAKQQIFNVNKIDSFWKKMLSRIFMARKEMSMPGFKELKNRMSLLFRIIAPGDSTLLPIFETLGPFRTVLNLLCVL